ncbi:hypothetical protein F5884DRAFT_164406 [Xylogone sp. PMI_703]|nr:hypothetical protein F5884DRAFT_164406 [Xylogone sp. PMI_703]
MAKFESLSESIKQLHLLLEPYIHERQDVSCIRRILTAHLIRPNDEDDSSTKSHPLSLLDTKIDTDGLPTALRGVRREYVRCIRANLNAQKEYDELTTSGDSEVKFIDGPTLDSMRSDTPLEPFLRLVRIRQKYERLRILQDYFDMLEQQPAAATEYLEPRTILGNLPALPRAPLEIIHHPTDMKNTQGANLDHIVDQLEKSVLNAKVALKREQKLLVAVTSQGTVKESQPPTNNNSKLQALGLTRNELINWIETELGKAGDATSPEEAISNNPAHKVAGDDVETELTLVQKQYARYNITRQSLIYAVTGKVELPLSKTYNSTSATPLSNDSVQIGIPACHVVAPYLEEMLKVSNEQKSFIQQRSHLAISLAKQLKESGQGLDRLVEESHLLPAHPTPATKSKHRSLDASVPFGEGTMNSEKPDTAHRAQAWKFASQSADAALSTEISEKLQDGRLSFVGTNESLSQLRQHIENFGKGQERKNLSQKGGNDVWSSINGNLGVIMRDGSDIDNV